MATERLKENDGVELTGQQKMVLFAKLSSGFWTANTNNIINPGNDLSDADIAKLRRDKAVKQRFDQYVNDVLQHIHNNNEGFRDRFVDEVYSALKSVLAQQSA